MAAQPEDTHSSLFKKKKEERMSTRIDDLEKNIADLMTQAGVEETPQPSL
uniref:Uncharacterized protein n=1 Tax=Denticeps clupeoides TaxID=299321 RepID=A0AAY4DWJ9_9TELE